MSSAAESWRVDRDWKANLVPPSRVAHSPKPGVSRSSRRWKDAHDAAREEGPTAGSAWAASGTPAQQCTGCSRSKGGVVRPSPPATRPRLVSSDAEKTRGNREPPPPVLVWDD